MRHPFVTTTAIAVVVIVIAGRSTVSPCAAERELVCEANGMTDFSSARKQITPQTAERRKLHKSTTHHQQYTARHQRGSKVRVSHHREKLKLRRYKGRDTLALRVPTPPAPATPTADVAAAPDTRAVTAPPAADAPVPVARRLAETFDLVGYDTRRSGREDALAARAQTANGADGSSVASAPATTVPVAGLPAAAVPTPPTKPVPPANTQMGSAQVASAQEASVASTQAASTLPASAPTARAEMANRAAVDAPDDSEHEPTLGAVQVLPLIAFGALGATFLTYVAVDLVRQRRQRRARHVRRSYHWHAPQHDIEPGELPAWLLPRQDSSDEVSLAEANEAPLVDNRRRTFLHRRIAAFRPLLLRPALLRLRGLAR